MQSVVDGAVRDDGENERLNVQHELVKSVMGGKLLLAPVDLSLSNLRILDSGTAQANWILDMAKLVLPSVTLCGSDIAPQHFPSPDKVPRNVELFAQSIFEPWPADIQGTFDVVHQRFVLAACKTEAQAAGAVAGLYGLVKPGGWVELHEGNLMTVQEGEKHRAMMRFRDIAVQAWTQIGQIPDAGKHIAKWLRQAGAVDIYEETQVVKIGAAADNKHAGEMAQTVCLQLFGAIQKMVAGKKFPFV